MDDPAPRRVPRADAPVAAVPVPLMWVLAQVAPRFEILAASPVRARLHDELVMLYAATFEAGAMDSHFAIRPTNLIA